LRNNLRADEIVDSLYRAWIEQNLQKLAADFKDRFGSPVGRTVYTQKEFHDFCIAQALVGFKVLDPELFRTILVDHLINTHYSLNRVKVSLEECGLGAFKKDESN
jgi:hypothetical protein